MTLIKSGTILFAAAMVGNASNYLFQFFMSRQLTLQDYGALNALFSILVITSIPTATIMLVVAKYISIFNVKEEDGKIAALYKNSLLKMAALGGLFLLAFFVFNGPIRDYLRIEDGLLVVVIGLSLFFSFLITVNLGALQGLQRFYGLGAGLGLGGVFKLVFGAGLVLLGFGLAGAVSSVAISGLIVFAMTLVPLSGYFKKSGPVESHTKEILSYSVPVLISSGAFAVLTNIDLVFVKHLFPSDEAGLYSAVSVLGKTILYLPAAFVLAIFPMVSQASALNHDTFRILDKGLLYTVAICLSCVVGLFFFPELAIRILFGGKFLGAAPLLKYYGVAMMFMSVVSILISFNLARHRTGFIYSLLAGCVALVALINFFHDSLLTVILAIIGVSVCLTAANLWMVYQERLAGRRREPGMAA